MTEALALVVQQVPWPAPPVTLSRQHVRRLRHYYERGRHSRATAMNDMLDLDLEVMGQLVIDRKARWGSPVELTAAGRESIFKDRQENAAARRGHNTLASRVASWLKAEGRLAWENIEFIVDGEPGRRQAVRPDVFSILPTHDIRRASPMVHEVKISRSDFLADLANPSKRQGYAALAGSVTYVAPVGLISPEEIPQGCNLLVELEEGKFKKVKAARSKRVELSSWALLNLVLKSREN
jgi:hypothetical protein